MCTHLDWLIKQRGERRVQPQRGKMLEVMQIDRFRLEHMVCPLRASPRLCVLSASRQPP